MLKNKKSLYRYFGILLYVVFLILMIFVISRKVDYHIDETLSYGLANYTKGYFVDIKEYQKYEPAADPFIEYLSVQPGQRRSLNIAWSNQTNDSHPPFYYGLVHLVGGLKVGTFSKWFAGSINIVFALLTLFLIRRITELLTEDDLIRELISAGFVLNYGILSDSAFFRMYFMSMFFVTLTAYLILLQTKKDRKLWFYLPIIFIVYAGTLTHYYCLLFDILISVVYCLRLLFKKKWKDVVLYCLSMAVAAAMTIVTFPAIIPHLFTTGHAQDAFSGIAKISDYFSRIWTCFNILNDMLFGKLLFILIPAIVILAFLGKKEQNAKEQRTLFVIMLLPTLLFFVIISVTASYLNERYFTPIFALLYCGILVLFLLQIKRWIAGRRVFVLSSTVLLIVLTALSYVGGKWPYLYRKDLEYLNKAKEHGDSDCVCIHGPFRLGWEVQLNFNEFIKYKSFILMDQSEIDMEYLKKNIDSDKVVISLIDVENEKEYIQQIINTFPQFTSYELIGGNGNGNSYFLY